MASRKKQKKRNKPLMADYLDRHDLYEQSVQCVEAEIDFVDETFFEIRNRRAISLREDFCGTMITSCEWVKRRDDNIAFCVDLDSEVLEWGRNNKIANLTPEQQLRMTVFEENVLNVETKPVDVALAMNFSYWILKERDITIEYFKKIHASLVDDGIFFLDAYGGYETFQEMEEETEHDDFSYIWDQHKYDPISGIAECRIHFSFKDGSKMKNAFKYEWRVWLLPEITNMLEEAGFKVTIYWEGTDDDGEGNGIYLPATEGEADAGWIAYIVAEK